jgi:hypothetical protein
LGGKLINVAVDSVSISLPCIMVPPGDVKNPRSMLLLNRGLLFELALPPPLMQESFPRSVPGVVDDPPPLYFFNLYIS